MARLRIMLVKFPARTEMSIINLVSGEEWIIETYPLMIETDFVSRQAKALQRVVEAEDIINSSGRD